MEKTQEKARQKEEELRQAEEAAGTPGNDGESKRNRVDQLLQEAQSQAQLKRGLEEELKEAMVPYKNAERNLGAVKKKQSSAAKQLKAAKQRLQEARDQIMSNADSAESEEARRTALLKKSEETLASARAKVDELKQDQSKWLRSYEEIEPHVRDSTSKVDRLKKQLQGVQHTLRSLQSSSGRDSLALLGPRVATVAQMVSCQYQSSPTYYVYAFDSHNYVSLRSKRPRRRTSSAVMSPVPLDVSSRLLQVWTSLHPSPNLRLESACLIVLSLPTITTTAS
jgi:DNA repair exonuclease SbcCD ATPase subunit